MAYCLRDLPPCAQTLIDEMCQHWRDLEQLKAAGGTPTARIMKGLRVGYASDGTVAFVVIHQDKGHVRSVVCSPKIHCWMCDMHYAMGHEYAKIACNGSRRGRWPWFMLYPGVDRRMHNLIRSRGFRAWRHAARE